MVSTKPPLRQFCLFVLVSFLAWGSALSAHSDESNTLPLTLELRLKESRPLQKDCYGANFQLLSGPIWFDHPDLIKKYIEAGKPFFRFPGGTLALPSSTIGSINCHVPSAISQAKLTVRHMSP